jgi:transposase
LLFEGWFRVQRGPVIGRQVAERFGVHIWTARQWLHDIRGGKK